MNLEFRPDFILIPDKIMAKEGVTPFDAKLYGYIYWLERLKDGRCTASNETLAQLARSTASTVQNSLVRLEKNGCIIRKYADKERKKRMVIECLVAFNRVPLDSGTVPLGGGTRVPLDSGQNKNVLNNNTIIILFDRFWDSYPRKVGKKKAQQIWQRINPSPELAAKIMLSLADHKASSQWSKDNGQFIPHPSTWLYQERWNDVLLGDSRTPQFIDIGEEVRKKTEVKK